MEYILTLIPFIIFISYQLYCNYKSNIVIKALIKEMNYSNSRVMAMGMDISALQRGENVLFKETADKITEEEWNETKIVELKLGKE